MNMQAGEDLHGNFAHKELVVLDDPVEVPAEFTTALGQMHQHYRDMAQAFVADDAEAADAAAQKMREQVENLSVDGLDTEAKDAWQSHRKVMRTRLHQLTSAEEIENLANVTIDEMKRAASDMNPSEVARARAQMKASMQKVGVNRQSELMRKLLLGATRIGVGAN
jgi:hypothetical protein